MSNADVCKADVLVVGAGPAGCATALALLAAGRSVTVLDRAVRPAPRAGEILPPAAWPVIDGLGLAARFRGQRHLPADVVRCRWGPGPPYEIDLSLHPYGGGWHLDRGRFDAMLRQAVRERGGVLLHGRPGRLRRAEDRWQVEVCAGSVPMEASVLVDASGRARAVARRLGSARDGVDALVALVATGSRPLTGPFRVATVIEADDAGWWYAGRLPGGRVVAGFLTDPDLLPTGGERLPDFFRTALSRTTLVAQEWADVVGAAALRVAPAGTTRLRCPAGPGWLAVGDAAMACDPLSGHGVAAALGSGVRAAAIVDRMVSGDADAHHDHVREAAADYAVQLRLRAHHYGQVQRHTPFWSRRHP